MEIVDYIDAKVEGMDKIESKRRVTAMDTTLSKEPLDEKDPGYQVPEPREDRPLNLDKPHHQEGNKQRKNKKEESKKESKDGHKGGKKEERKGRKQYNDFKEPNDGKVVEQLKIEKKEKPQQENEKTKPQRGAQGAKNKG
jgi:hypothetical protein